MSSARVVTATKAFLTANFASEKQVDLSGSFTSLDDLITSAGGTPGAAWLGLEFFGTTEEPVTIPSTNTKGKFRENGAISIHVVAPAILGAATGIRTRVEALRNKFRAARIGGPPSVYLVESVSPASFAKGATLDFEGGYVSATFQVFYESDLDL